jgi:DNA-binding NarL/FixJ family response regulator
LVKVLLVEESPIILGFLHEVLPRAGVEVVGETGLPQAAVNTLRERKPDVVLIDLDLHDALSLVKIAVSERPDLCVIGYAGNCTESLVVEARKAGVSDLMAKPLGESRLLEALEKCRGTHIEEPVHEESTEAEVAPAEAPATAESSAETTAPAEDEAEAPPEDPAAPPVAEAEVNEKAGEEAAATGD